MDYSIKEKDRWSKLAKNQGYKMIITPNKWVFVKAWLWIRKNGNAKTHVGGRIIKMEFCLNGKEIMHFVGVHRVAQEEVKLDNARVQVNTIKTKSMLNWLVKIKNHHYKKCSRMITDSHLEIAGNLPGTIPTTEFDNDDRTTYNQHKKGVLWWCLGEGSCLTLVVLIIA